MEAEGMGLGVQRCRGTIVCDEQVAGDGSQRWQRNGSEVKVGIQAERLRYLLEDTHRRKLGQRHTDE